MLFQEFLDKTQLIDPIKGRIPLEKTPVVDMFTKAFDETDRGLFLTSRQVVASTIIDLYALYQALILGKKVLVLANKEIRARGARELLDINEHLVLYKNKVIKHSKSGLSFSNGGEIIFGHMGTDAHRGIEYEICLVHDYAFASEKDQQKCWDSVINIKGVKKAYIYSCANINRGKFYDLWENTKKGCKSVSNWKYYKFTYQDALKYEWNYYTNTKESLKKSLDKSAFDMEYECKFQEAPEKSSEVVNLRVTTTEKDTLQRKADALNFRSISEYLRFVGLNSSVNVNHDMLT